MERTPTSMSASCGFLCRASAALFLLTSFLGCVAPEEKNGGFTPPAEIAQLAVSPSSVSFTSDFGLAPGDNTVDITGASGPVSGLGVGTTLYSPIVSGWLSVSVGGAQSTPATMVLRVIPPADLKPGNYTASVPVVSTVTGVTTRYILATFKYKPGPILQVSPTSISVAGDAGGTSPAQQTVTIENIGAGNLTGLSAGPVEYGPGATGWLTATLNQTTAPALLSLQANITGLAVGTYVARVPVTSSRRGIVPDTVTVSFGVGATAIPPTIDLSPSVIAVSATAGGADPTVQNVAVTNSGGGALTDLGLGSITYGGGAGGWLTASLVGTTAPTTLNLQAATGSLAAGTYTATVQISSGLSGVTPTSTVVTFNVSAAAVPPSINLSPSTATLTATSGAANPAPITVDIAYGGGGNLALLSLGATNYGPGAAGWLTPTLGLTAAPSTIKLDANITGLAAGN